MTWSSSEQTTLRPSETCPSQPAPTQPRRAGEQGRRDGCGREQQSPYLGSSSDTGRTFNSRGRIVAPEEVFRWRSSTAWDDRQMMRYPTDRGLDVRPPFQLVQREDGTFWVKGDGLSLEFDSMEEGQAFIDRLHDDQNEAIEEYFAGTL